MTCSAARRGAPLAAAFTCLLLGGLWSSISFSQTNATTPGPAPGGNLSATSVMTPSEAVTLTR